MTVFVIDTNIFVASLSSTSVYHWIIRALLKEQFILCISNEIQLEYEEVLIRKYGFEVATNFIKALEELPNVQKVDIHYKWDILPDADDNKFIDATVAGGASFLVSEDKHFRILYQIDFPKISLMRLAEFSAWYESEYSK